MVPYGGMVPYQHTSYHTIKPESTATIGIVPIHLPWNHHTIATHEKPSSFMHLVQVFLFILYATHDISANRILGALA